MLRHGLNMQRSAELIRVLETNDSDEEQPPSESMVSNIPLHQALHPLATASAARPFFFLSHSSDSHPSALAASAERVLGGVADLLEQVSGQDVLASTRGVAHQACCSGAQAVLVLLSPAYLASRLSLLELGMALEAHLGRGAPLLAVTVDARVHGSIADSGRARDSWAALGAEGGVAEATGPSLMGRQVEEMLSCDDKLYTYIYNCRWRRR